MEEFEDSANGDQERKEVWEAGTQEPGAASDTGFWGQRQEAVMSDTGFYYEDWGQDFWNLVFISRLVSRLLGLQSLYQDW